MTNLYGYLVLDRYVEHFDSYQSITGSEDDEKKMQKALKTAEMDKFWAMLFLRGSDQLRFGGLMTEWSQAYTNKRDHYTTIIANIVNVMRIMIQKKRDNRKKTEQVRMKQVQWKRPGWHKEKERNLHVIVVAQIII